MCPHDAHLVANHGVVVAIAAHSPGRPRWWESAAGALLRRPRDTTLPELAFCGVLLSRRRHEPPVPPPRSPSHGSPPAQRQLLDELMPNRNAKLGGGTTARQITDADVCK